MPKIAFVSPHCLVDFSNGAAIATREGLKLLAAHGFRCMAFCGTRLDEAGEGLVQEQLFRRRIGYEVRKVRLGGAGVPALDGLSPPMPAKAGTPAHRPHPSPLPEGEGEYTARLIFLVDGNVPITLFENGSTRGGWFGPQEVKAFLAACDIFLRKNRPDIVVTYGGNPVSIAVQRLVKGMRVSPSLPAPLPAAEGSPVLVFWLRNFSYHHRKPFELVDYVIVPSEFSKRYYREKLGLQCNVLPSVVQWKGAECRAGFQPAENMTGWKPAPHTADWKSAPRYVTFINPQKVKGVYVFARIARELAVRRPDIPLLVVQGRGRGEALKDPALGLAAHLRGELQPDASGPLACASGLYGRDGRNITTMPFTPNPGDFYPRSKLVLMPSLWNESFGLVAVEAMLNGIPVLASNRGALPETVRGKEPAAVGCVERIAAENGGFRTKSTAPERSTLACGDSCNAPSGTEFCASPTLRLPEGEGTGGFLFDIPARYTPQTRDVPTAEEVAPWVETIIRLWDDAAYYERCSIAARQRAQAWHPDRLALLYRDFFSRLARQPVLASASQASLQGPSLAQTKTSGRSRNLAAEADLQPRRRPSPFVLMPQDLTIERMANLRRRLAIQLAAGQLLAVCRSLQAKPRCNFLVFGMGNDSPLWLASNRNGRTAFLEDNPAWFDSVGQRFPALEGHLVAYPTRVRQWCEILHDPNKLRMALPPTVANVRWDVVLVDGPAGWHDDAPGRMCSIYAASAFAADDADVFVHDCERPLEASYCDLYLTNENLVEEIGAGAPILRHYRMPRRE